MMPMSDIDWKKALCLRHDPELFFADDADIATQAVAICDHCPIVHDCLTWAITKPEKYGVWGGTTEKDRKTLLSKRKRVICPGCGSREVLKDAVAERLELCRACGLSWEV